MVASKSKIEWTETTWNPVTGCNKVSFGCKNCYAERMAKRLQKMGVHKYRNGFETTIHPELLREPLSWKTPRVIFVNSMSDLFHEKVPDSFIIDVFNVMKEASQHTFQVLTKRPERARELNNRLVWPPNVWLGTSIETNRWIKRLEPLKETDARIKFLSLEPLLGPLSESVLNLDSIDWVIVGGESGPRARPMKEEWVIEIRNNCLKNEVSFFFKQWGGVFKKRTGRKLDESQWNQRPETARPSAAIA